MGSPFPIVHAKWSLEFRSFSTSSQRLKTASSLVYYNYDDLEQQLGQLQACSLLKKIRLSDVENKNRSNYNIFNEWQFCLTNFTNVVENCKRPIGLLTNKYNPTAITDYNYSPSLHIAKGEIRECKIDNWCYTCKTVW